MLYLYFLKCKKCYYTWITYYYLLTYLHNIYDIFILVEKTSERNLFFRDVLCGYSLFIACRGSGPININKRMSGPQIRPRKPSSVSHAAYASRQQHPSPLQIVEWDVKQFYNKQSTSISKSTCYCIFMVRWGNCYDRKSYGILLVWNPDRAT